MPVRSRIAVSRAAASVNCQTVCSITAAAQRGDQLPVVVDGGPPPLRVGGVHQHRHVAGGVEQEPGQLDPAAGLVEDPVEAELEARDGLGVAGPDGRGERVVDAIQLVDLGVGDVVGGRGGQLLGDGRLQPEDVLDVLAGERQHHVTAVRFQLHHALAAQLQQGLAHRGDADAELGRGLVEPDEGARPQRAGHDRGPQVPRDLVGQLGPAQRPPAPRLHGHRCVHGACQGFQWLGGTGFTF